MTIGEISRATGIERPNISRFVNGKAGASIKSLERMAAAIGVAIVLKPGKEPTETDMAVPSGTSKEL